VLWLLVSEAKDRGICAKRLQDRRMDPKIQVLPQGRLVGNSSTQSCKSHPQLRRFGGTANILHNRLASVVADDNRCDGVSTV